MERRSAELRELTDVKIPANSEAIGKAAALGDLSENSEWEAAIEEQRNLTARAQEMEAEIRSAELIDEVALPADTVAPGTRVSYREVATQEEHSIVILGPWDAHGEEVISYRAPLAAGMLGLQAGSKGTLDLPSGAIEIEVLTIEAFDVAGLAADV